MLGILRSILNLAFLSQVVFFATISAAGQIRDGGIDPSNLGKGDWVYSISDATNKVGGRYSNVTNENSLMLFYKSQGIRYMIIKAATGASLFNGCYSFPQFNSNLVNIAHANGILIFGYNRSYATNVAGEVALVNYIFGQGADGFVWDAEAEWESGKLGTQGPSLAWQQCSTVRSNWPNKFLAHAPFPIIYLHSSFPYKEFGFWCDAVMPQIYHFSATKGSQSAAINWSDINWRAWQNSLAALPPTNINGIAVHWTNAIKPLAPINDVYGPFGRSPCEGTTSAYPDKHVMEFMDYLIADPMPQTVGGYQGVSFWRTDLHGTNQWSNIKSGTSGNFTGIVNNVVIDDPNATRVGAWTSVSVWASTTTSARFFGNGSGTDTNAFGTNYLIKTQGSGLAYVQFTPNIIVPGNYDLYEWHPSLTNASATVPFLITSSGGSTNVYANQQTNGGNWSFLGRFPFAAGAGGSVKISDNFPEPGSVAVADGLKFAFAGPLAQAPPAAPSDLAATAISTSRVDLVWFDTATNETGFVIARSTNSGGPYTDLPLLPANTTNYSDIGLAPNTAYFYVVRAFNDSASSTNSSEATAITFAVPPAIVTQPLSQSVFLGQDATFSVSVSGSPPFAYQWFFNYSSISNATNSSYTVASAITGNAGSYYVLVTNIAGQISSSNASLTVFAVAAFGDNSFGQLNVPAAAIDALAISAGEWHSLALRPNGSILAWGNNYNGQCNVPDFLTNAVAIASGGYHNLAITTDGHVRAWGANDYGQCSVPNNVSNALAIAAGTWHSVALLDNGSVIAWGDNDSGQSLIPFGLSDVVAISARGNHSLALRADGSIAAWGDNNDSEGFFAGQSIVPANASNVVLIAAGDFHSLALKSDGTLMCWGDNSLGQCAPSSSLNAPAMIAGGAFHNIALNLNGTATAWGSDHEGQCDLPLELSGIVAVAAGAHHSLLLFDSGTSSPRLFNSAWSSTQFKVRAQTPARKNYALEFKDSLSASAWNPLATNHGNGALLQFVDPAPSSSRRFYRLRQW